MTSARAGRVRTQPPGTCAGGFDAAGIGYLGYRVIAAFLPVVEAFAGGTIIESSQIANIRIF